MSLLPALVAREISHTDHPMKPSRWYLGIDLGTTYSTAAVVDAQALQSGDREAAMRLVSVAQETEYGLYRSPLLPSFVAEVSKGDWRVGMRAKEALRDGLVRGRRIFYSTKSEMGLGREPFYPYAASPDVDCPYKVAARILSTLAEAVRQEYGEEALENVIVTVPASFQLAARKDTIHAAELAGLPLSERCLFDEPNAALLDYLFTVAGQSEGGAGIDLTGPRTILVFDFGGGTCDISIVRAQMDADEGRLSLSNLAISRFEQLGGDNIDTAIAEQFLLPLFLEQNQLDPLDLTLDVKTKYLLPVLVDVAEALKLGLCAEYATQLSLRPHDAIRRDEIVATQPSVGVRLPQRSPSGKRERLEYLLASPSLTLDQLDRVLQPFLDSDRLYTQNTTYTSITSVLAPVIDALSRAGLQQQEVDAVLLAGGSSLIPQVQQALQTYLPGADMLRFQNVERTQFAIARGAALQSLFVHGLGSSLLKPIAQESIGILTQDGGFLPLVPVGTELPYPADGGCYDLHDALMVPEDGMREMHIVLAADSADKPLGVQRMRFLAPPRAGERVAVQWRLGANKILNVLAYLADRRDVQCELTLENPLCSTGFQSAHQRRIAELEQLLSSAAARREAPSATFTIRRELGWLYLQLGRAEKALDWARSALQAAPGPDSQTLHMMARAYDRLDRLDRAEARYRDAVAADPQDASALFSLSLCLERQHQLNDALETVEKALALNPDEGAYLAHRADLLKQLGRASEACQTFQEAAQSLVATGLPHPYQSSWLRFVAHQIHDDSLRQAAEEAETRNRQRQTPFDPSKLPRAREDEPPGPQAPSHRA